MKHPMLSIQFSIIPGYFRGLTGFTILLGRQPFFQVLPAYFNFIAQRLRELLALDPKALSAERRITRTH